MRKGNIIIGAGTYINGGERIVTGPNSKIIIGKNCAIGRYFGCASITHDLKRPTRSNEHIMHLQKEADILIGDGVYIGERVTIKEGVTIGDHAVIGAGAVVTKDVSPFSIVGGIPAKHIRFNTEHEKYKIN